MRAEEERESDFAIPELGLAPPPPAAAAAGGLATPTDQKSGSGTTAEVQEEKELMEMAMEEE